MRILYHLRLRSKDDTHKMFFVNDSFLADSLVPLTQQVEHVSQGNSFPKPILVQKYISHVMRCVTLTHRFSDGGLMVRSMI